MTSLTDRILKYHRAAYEEVGDILRAHNPDKAWVDQVAAAVTGTARNFGREPSELAAELVQTLGDPPAAPEGFIARVQFSVFKRTYLWQVMKLTRQQRRYAARCRAKG